MFFPVIPGVALVMFACLPQCVPAQCSSTNYLSGSAFINDNSVGTYAFSGGANAAVSDDSYASASATVFVLSGNTQYLKATGFSLSVPANATICGVEVEVEKSASGITVLATVSDNAVRIVKNGTITGTNHAVGGDWPNGDVATTYGSSSDLWGTTLSAANVNSVNFGVAFSAGISGLIGVIPTANIDRVRIRIYYNIAITLLLNDLKITMHNNLPVINCSIQNDEHSIASIYMQRSINNNKWTTIFSKDNLLHGENIVFTDYEALTGDNFYRVMLYKNDELRSVSPIKKITVLFEEHITLYPNPAGEYIYFHPRSKAAAIKTYDLNGRQVLDQQKIIPGLNKVYIGKLLPGIYYVNNGTKFIRFIKR